MDAGRFPPEIGASGDRGFEGLTYSHSHAGAECLPIAGPGAERLVGQRATEEVALSEIAAAQSDEFELFVGFHALTDDTNAQAMRHGDDRLDHRSVSRVARDIDDE